MLNERTICLTYRARKFFLFVRRSISLGANKDSDPGTSGTGTGSP